MSWITSTLRQDITFWNLVGMNENGDPIYSLPSHIKGRWEDTNEVNLSSSGQEFISQAVVYLDRDVKLGDFLYLGISIEVNPINQKDAKIVKLFSKIPTITAKRFERKAIL